MRSVTEVKQELVQRKHAHNQIIVLQNRNNCHDELLNTSNVFHYATQIINTFNNSRIPANYDKVEGLW